jgi:hypothetical protein
MDFGYLFEEDGIYLTSSENRMMSTTWDDVDFEYICADLTCDHKGEGCSAKLVDHGDGIISSGFGVKYQDKLIIFDSYAELKSSDSVETDEDFYASDFRYKTDVYEANLDGTNRVKKLEFDGSIEATYVSNAVALIDNKIFFGGPLRDYTETPINEDGTTGEPTIEYDGAVYEVDLDNYTCKTYATFTDDPDPSWLYSMSIYDGNIYASEYNSVENKTRWYQINPETEKDLLLKEFSTGYPLLEGVIDDTIYYQDDEKNLTIYTSPINDSEKENVFLTFEGTATEDAADIFNVFTLDDMILVQTSGSADEGNDYSEYTWYDTDGNAKKTVKYDKYITYADVVGDRIIYMTPYEEQEEWWCNKEDFENLEEKSTYIGSIFGREHDTIDAETN